MDNKKPFFWLVFTPLLQMFVMYYLYQKTHHILVVLLSASVYLVFTTIYYFKYAEVLDVLNFPSANIVDKLKKQQQIKKLLIQSLFFLIITDILIMILFKIDFDLSSSISMYSGPLGILTSNGLYSYNKEN